MSILSDVFSGKITGKQALEQAKHKLLAATIIGGSLLSPMQAFSQTNNRGADNDSIKTEIVVGNEQKTDSVAADTASTYIVYSNPRIQSCADKMMKTPTGKAVLTKVSKLNVDIKMDPSVSDDLGGYYSFGSDAILINPTCSDALISSILVHEGSHAIQSHNGCKLNARLDAQSYFNLNKAMEADAFKNQVMAAYELKQQGDASVFNAFRSEHKDYCDNYVKLAEKYKDNKDSLQMQTFLYYYKDKSYIKTYEDRYTTALNTFVKSAKPDQCAGLFQTHLTDAHIIKHVCTFNGTPYMTLADTTYIQNSDCNFVQNSTYKKLGKISEKFDGLIAKSNNAILKPDTSYHNFYVVDYKGNIKQLPLNQQQQPAKQENAPTAPVTLALRPKRKEYDY
ncbi:MAG: hypothetical protein MJ247_00370 [Alphaproteobacteria bacterium]|nr:hypothetical protein [Alphaproteobacteria bacterium]